VFSLAFIRHRLVKTLTWAVLVIFSMNGVSYAAPFSTSESVEDTVRTRGGLYLVVQEIEEDVNFREWVVDRLEGKNSIKAIKEFASTNGARLAYEIKYPDIDEWMNNPSAQSDFFHDIFDIESVREPMIGEKGLSMKDIKRYFRRRDNVWRIAWDGERKKVIGYLVVNLHKRFVLIQRLRSHADYASQGIEASLIEDMFNLTQFERREVVVIYFVKGDPFEEVMRRLGFEDDPSEIDRDFVRRHLEHFDPEANLKKMVYLKPGARMANRLFNPNRAKEIYGNVVDVNGQDVDTFVDEQYEITLFKGRKALVEFRSPNIIDTTDDDSLVESLATAFASSRSYEVSFDFSGKFPKSQFKYKSIQSGKDKPLFTAGMWVDPRNSVYRRLTLVLRNEFKKMVERNEPEATRSLMNGISSYLENETARIVKEFGEGGARLADETPSDNLEKLLKELEIDLDSEQTTREQFIYLYTRAVEFLQGYTNGEWWEDYSRFREGLLSHMRVAGYIFKEDKRLAATQGFSPFAYLLRQLGGIYKEAGIAVRDYRKNEAQLKKHYDNLKELRESFDLEVANDVIDQLLKLLEHMETYYDEWGLSTSPDRLLKGEIANLTEAIDETKRKLDEQEYVDPQSGNRLLDLIGKVKDTLSMEIRVIGIESVKRRIERLEQVQSKWTEDGARMAAKVKWNETHLVTSEKLLGDTPMAKRYAGQRLAWPVGLKMNQASRSAIQKKVSKKELGGLLQPKLYLERLTQTVAQMAT